MASLAAAAAASNLPGLWLGELAAAVQGTWHAVAAGHGDPGPRQKLVAGDKKRTTAVQVQGAAAAGGKAMKEGDDVERCGGALSDTTLCLLLDRRPVHAQLS